MAIPPQSPRQFRVRLDLDRIRAACAEADGVDYATDYPIHLFLIESGFQPVPEAAGWWIVSESDLGAVRPDEVLELQPL